MSRTFFFLQNDIRINYFDKGVLILEPFFWGNVIFKLFVSKVTFEVGRNFFELLPRIVMLQSLIGNERFSLLFMLALLYKARADNLPGKAKQWKIFGT